LPAPLLPVPHEVGEQVARPAHPALEEGEAELREAPGDSAEEEGLGEGVAGIGEVPDVVVGEVVNGLAAVPAHAPRMAGHGHLQVDAGLTERTVAVRALEPERVDVLTGVGDGSR